MRKNFLYKMLRTMVRAYSTILFNMDVQWYERPPSGPKLYIANHPSASDPFLIHLLSDEPMGVLVSANAFTFPLLGLFVSKTGQIPVVPGEGQQALGTAKRYLEAGYSVGIFPEGNFSPQEGGYRAPRTGAARLALSTRVPVIPVGISLPREKSIRISSNLSGRQTVGYWYLRGPYSITVGKPLWFEGDAEDQSHVQSTAKNMMQWICSLAEESERRLRRLLPAVASA
jgi:1-acyl-sn-glycerol-3-phosphate acyltransferase